MWIIYNYFVLCTWYFFQFDRINYIWKQIIPWRFIRLWRLISLVNLFTGRHQCLQTYISFETIIRAIHKVRTHRTWTVHGEEPLKKIVRWNSMVKKNLRVLQNKTNHKSTTFLPRKFSAFVGGKVTTIFPQRIFCHVEIYSRRINKNKPLSASCGYFIEW